MPKTILPSILALLLLMVSLLARTGELELVGLAREFLMAVSSFLMVYALTQATAEREVAA